RMSFEKRLLFGRVGLACCRIGLRRHHVLVKGFGRTEREYRQVNHCSSPHFSVGRAELKPQTAHCVRCVCLIGLTATQREAADYRNAPRAEDCRLRKAVAVSVALEVSGDAHSLGMVAAETWVKPSGLLEPVSKSLGRERALHKPPPEICERSCNCRQNN